MEARPLPLELFDGFGSTEKSGFQRAMRVGGVESSRRCLDAMSLMRGRLSRRENVTA